MSSVDPPIRDGTGPASLLVPDALDVDQPFDADDLHALRSTAAAHASSLGLSGRQLEAVIIVVGEFATNAIRHGGGRGRLRLWHREDAIYCQVSDEGPGIVDRAVGSAPPRPDELDGRGLWICRRLAHDLVIERGANDRGAVVTAILRRDG
jgi:anti-sigma regulatory factor (Ser/Thr protein kinase)